MCCWPFSSPSKSKPPRNKKANTSSPRHHHPSRRAPYYSTTTTHPQTTSRTPLLGPRPAPAPAPRPTKRHRTTIAEPPPSSSIRPKKPSHSHSHSRSRPDPKLRGSGSKRHAPAPFPSPPPQWPSTYAREPSSYCPSCALHHPGHAHRAAHHHHHPRAPAAAPSAFPSARSRPPVTLPANGYAYGAGPVPPPQRHPPRSNTGRRRDGGPIIDVGTRGYGYGYGTDAFAVRAATRSALEDVRRQAFGAARPAAPGPGRRRGGGGGYPGATGRWPPFGGLEGWM